MGDSPMGGLPHGGFPLSLSHSLSLPPLSLSPTLSFSPEGNRQGHSHFKKTKALYLGSGG